MFRYLGKVERFDLGKILLKLLLLLLLVIVQQQWDERDVLVHGLQLDVVQVVVLVLLLRVIMNLVQNRFCVAQDLAHHRFRRDRGRLVGESWSLRSRA